MSSRGVGTSCWLPYGFSLAPFNDADKDGCGVVQIQNLNTGKSTTIYEANILGISR